MGYHIKLYSAKKEKAEAFNFDMERFKKSKDDYEYWDKFSKEFGKVFTYEFEIGDFLKYDNLPKIKSGYGDIHKISKEDFLDIIIQYNEHMFKYYQDFEDKIRLKLEGALTKQEDDLLLMRMYEFFRSKAWHYNKWDNNIKIDEKSKRLTNNWNFESDIIELVRIYKTTDFEKKSLICVGS